MFAKLIRLLEILSGSFLGGLAVSAQVGNVLICVLMLLAGPAFILGILTR